MMTPDEKTPQAQMKTGDFLKLLELTVDQEEKALETHQKRVQFFQSVIFAAFTIMAPGVWYANKFEHYMLLLLAVMVVYSICDHGIKSSTRTIRRFARILSTRVKIEEILGLHFKVGLFVDLEAHRKSGFVFRWYEECLIPTDHKKHVEDSESSLTFAEHVESNSYHKIAVDFFSCLKALSLLLAVYFLVEIVRGSCSC